MNLTMSLRGPRIALALLACGGGACDTSRERVAADPVPSAATADTARSPAQKASPLAAYPGFGRERNPDQARYRRQEIAMERHIAHCMQKAGFEYTPAPSIVNPPAPPPPQGPNQRYVTSLSAERRTQYNLTLYGVPDPNDEENLWDPRSPTGGGCWGEAIRAIRSVYAAKGELMTEYLTMERSISRDPRVQAAERRWSECMRSRGFSYATPQSIPAREVSAAIRGAHTPELERQSRQALDAAPACATAVGLDSVKAAVRVDKETEFVRAPKHVLDRHVERLRQQQPLLDSLLAQPPQRD